MAGPNDAERLYGRSHAGAWERVELSSPVNGAKKTIAVVITLAAMNGGPDMRKDHQWPSAIERLLLLRLLRQWRGVDDFFRLPEDKPWTTMPVWTQ